MKKAPLEELEVWLQRIVETVNSAQGELEEEDTLALEDTLSSAAECAEEALWLCRKQIDAASGMPAHRPVVPSHCATEARGSHDEVR